MKKLSISALAVTALAMLATSCSNEVTGDGSNPAKGGKQAMTFTATQESTRAAISGTDVIWQSSDVVTVWDGTSKNAFTVTPGTPATTATLSGEAAESGTFAAVYPNSVGQNCTYTSDAITGLVIPATQTATAGTFDPAAGIMTGYTTGTNLPVKNVCSFLKLTTAAAYTKIVVTVTSGNLAGTFSVASFGTEPTLTATSGTQTVTLQTDGTSTFAAGDYYIAVAPVTVSGLTVDCYTDATNYVEKTKTSDATFARNTVYDLGSTSDWKAPKVLVTSLVANSEASATAAYDEELIVEAQIVSGLFTVYPENATDKSLTYSSSDENVATVTNNADGTLTVKAVGGVTYGTIHIVGTTNDGSGISATSKYSVSFNDPY